MARSTVTAAQKAEAQDGTVSFEYDGETYTVQADALDDVETMLLFEEGKLVAAVRACIGVAQWAKFAAKKRSVSGDLTALSSAMFAAMGTSKGESTG